MVIGVDAGALCVTDDRLKVGVYRVTKHALLALAHLDKENNYRLYTFTPIEQGVVEAFDHRAQIVQLPQRGWHKVWLPLELKKRPVDVFLGFAQSLPSVKSLYDVGFIFDLGFLHNPEVYGVAAMTLKKQTDTLVRRSDHIITISEASRADILQEYGLPDERVSVAYPGVDPSFSPAGKVHKAGQPYVLFVGSLNKAKDIPTLLAMVARTHYDLYLVGGDYWPDPVIEETIAKLHLEDRVKRLGVVPDGELPTYYRGATAFVTTALREGFCLPAAEAMACGTPVVALDRGALREVVGKGGIIAKNTQALQDALMKMGDKIARASFSKKAIRQAKKFQWETFAEHIRSLLAYARRDLANNGYKKG